MQLAVDVPKELRGRARAAFRFVRFHGEAETFSEFIADAIDARIHQVEKAYNGGKPFDPEEGNLPAGRPSR